MNRDFHYYATYLAAREAGFDHDEAYTIAYASQYVDVSNKNMIDKKCLPELESVTATFEDTSEMFLKNLYTSKADLEETESIWSSFHFLPGNIHNKDDKREYKGSKIWGNSIWSNTYGDEEKRQFSLMCLPNSVLSELMINDIIIRRGESYYLELLGLRMHVLADTWAHCYYTGSPTWWINEVPQEVYYIGTERQLPFISVKSITELVKNQPFMTTPPALSFYSYMYLGHGRMGHVPDLPYIRYRYIPKWNDCEVEKDNPNDYMMAFRQLIYAMVCVKTKKQYLRGRYQDISNDLERAIKSALNNTKYEEERAAEIWNPIIKKFYNVVLPDYDNNRWLNEAKKSANKLVTHYYQFNRSAILHREFVKDYLNRVNGLIPEETVEYGTNKADYLIFSVSDQDSTDRRVATYIDYLGHDNNRWRAEYKGGLFVLYSQGDKNIYHTSDAINYVEPGSNRLWRATYKDGLFTHTAFSGEEETTVSDYIHYKSWDGNGYEASFANWNELDYDYMNSDFRKLNMIIFAFKKPEQQHFHTVSSKLFCLKKRVDSYAHQCLESYYMDAFKHEGFRVNDEVNNNSMMGYVYYDNEKNESLKLEIRNRRFYVNNVPSEYIEPLNYSKQKQQVYIAKWYDFT